MIKKVSVVNNGFKPGLSAKDLNILDIVTVDWNDSPDESVVITAVPHHAHNYKGYYSCKGLDREGNSVFFDSDQIVRKTGTVAL